MLVFAENFQGYGTDTTFMLDGLYAEVQNANLAVDPDPNAGGTTVFKTGVTAANSTRLRRVMRETVTTAGCAFRVWLDAIPYQGGETLCMGFMDENANWLNSIGVSPSGRLQIYQGATTAQILAETAAPVITAHSWAHVEVKFIAGGNIEIHVNGVSVLTVGGAAAGGLSQFAIGSPNSVGTFADWWFKDLVVWNSDGAHNNDFIGTCSVVSMIPDGDVSLGWTPATGNTGFNMIDQSPPTDGVDYISAPYPPPQPSTFTMTDLPVNVSEVKGLITQVRARKVDGGDGNVQTTLISGASPVNGSDRPMTTAFTYYEDVFETDPATGGNWTPAAADNAEIKINRTL